MKSDKSILKGFPFKKLNAALGSMFNSGMVAQFASQMGTGAKLSSFVHLEEKGTKWVVEVFAESYIDDAPKSGKDGYTIEEIKHHSGVYISRHMGTTPKGDRYFGVYIPMDEINKKLSSVNRVLLYRYLDTLKSKTEFTEDDLERFSHLYANRNPGSNPFGSRRLN